MSDRSPGNPHADRPNWQPAETVEDYIRNVDDGLEDFSESRLREFMGWSRKNLWRARWIGEIPDELFEILIELPNPPSPTELAYVGRALHGHETREIERCPHCGEVLRIRLRYRRETAKAVNDWLKARR